MAEGSIAQCTYPIHKLLCAAQINVRLNKPIKARQAQQAVVFHPSLKKPQIHPPIYRQ